MQQTGTRYILADWVLLLSASQVAEVPLSQTGMCMSDSHMHSCCRHSKKYLRDPHRAHARAAAHLSCHVMAVLQQHLYLQALR